jgi:hypothetical protein
VPPRWRAHVLDFADELPHEWFYRICAKEHRLLETPGMQKACGEHVASFRIGTELDLIDRQEVDWPIKRHRFDGAYEIGRAGRGNLLLAGDQSNRARAP